MYVFAHTTIAVAVVTLVVKMVATGLQDDAPVQSHCHVELSIDE